MSKKRVGSLLESFQLNKEAKLPYKRHLRTLQIWVLTVVYIL